MSGAARRAAQRVSDSLDIQTGQFSLPEDPGEAMSVVRERAKRYGTDPGYQAKMGQAAVSIEDTVLAMLDHMVETGQVSPEIMSFYASRGVPMDTLERLASGALPMDEASRRARAKEMGLDFDMSWARHDLIGLDHPRLQHRGGLTYAGFTPWLADQAAVSKGQLYPIMGPPEIIGLQPIPGMENPLWGLLSEDEHRQLREVVDESRALANAGIGRWQDKAQSIGANEAIERGDKLAWKLHRLNANASDDALQTLKERAVKAETPSGPEWGWARPWSESSPDFRLLESKAFPENPLSTSEEVASQMVQDKARSIGAKGTLVGDEAGASVAFMQPAQLRHSTLSILDPAYKNTPGYMRSFAPLLLSGQGEQEKTK